MRDENKTKAINEGGILSCVLCNDIIEECCECGKQFEDNEIIYCNEVEHCCKDCEEFDNGLFPEIKGGK